MAADQEVRYCNACGASNPQGARYCNACGQPTAFQDNAAPPTTNPNPPAPSAANGPSRNTIVKRTLTLSADRARAGEPYPLPPPQHDADIHERRKLNNFQLRGKTLQPITISDNKKLDDSIRSAIILPVWSYQVAFFAMAFAILEGTAWTFPHIAAYVPFVFTAGIMLRIVDGWREARRAWVGGKKPFGLFNAVQWVALIGLVYAAYTFGYNFTLPVFVFILSVTLFSFLPKTIGSYYYYHLAGCEKYNLPV